MKPIFVPAALRSAVLLSAMLTSACGPLGMNPWPLPWMAPPAAVPVQPAALPPVQPTPTPSVGPASTRMKGLATLNERPFTGARMHAIDLATGKQIPLLATGAANLVAAGAGNLVAAGAGNLVAAGAGNYALSQAGTTTTGEDGHFDFTLPPLAPGQVVKIVAERDGQSLLTLVDGAGRSLATPQAAGYALAETVTSQLSLNLNLRLSASTSAAAKAFEGIFKINFQLDPNARDASLATAMAEAQEAVDRLAATLDGNEALCNELATALNEMGELEDLPVFQSVIDAMGATGELADQVRALLKSFVARDPEDEAGGKLDAVTSEDFPVGEVTITREGDFTFIGEDGEEVTGDFQDGAFVPNQEEPTTPEEPDSPDPDTGDARGGLDVTDGTLIDPTAPEGLE